MLTRFATLIALAVAVGAAAVQAQRRPFDLVLRGGRVMDPASGLDAVRHIAVRDGRIAAISTRPLEGREVIDVSGFVVAPGFIDLHAHGQNLESSKWQAHDGVTTALELESGAPPPPGVRVVCRTRGEGASQLRRNRLARRGAPQQHGRS